MLYVITGCSCGGKSTLIDKLAEFDCEVIKEPGRIIVQEELCSGGDALPWINAVGFAKRCIELSVKNHVAASQSSLPVFLDRSLLDAVSALMFELPQHAKRYFEMTKEYRYASSVFLAPPWAELFENDAERQHSFEDAVDEYDRLIVTYSKAGYDLVELPMVPVDDRVEFVLERIR